MKKQWAAVVLAGGAGRRLGGKDKTKLAYREQESFLEHILKELQDFSPIYLSGHPGPSPQRTWLIADKLSGMGPMVGLWSVFSACGEDALLSVPCDMPYFSRDLASWHASAAEAFKADCLVCRDNVGRIHPLCGVYRRSCVPHMEACIREGKLSMRELLSRTETILLEPQKHGFPEYLFMNINTAEDLRLFYAHDPRNP